MDPHTKEQRSRNMQAIKSTGTRDEVLLAKNALEESIPLPEEQPYGIRKT